MGHANLYRAQPLGIQYVSNHGISGGSYPLESNLEAELGIKISQSWNHFTLVWSVFIIFEKIFWDRCHCHCYSWVDCTVPKNLCHDFMLRKSLLFVRKVPFRITLRSDNVPFSHHILCESTNPSQTHKLRIRKFFVRKRYIFAAKTCAKGKPSQPKRDFRNHNLPFETFLCVDVCMKTPSSKSNIFVAPTLSIVLEP